MHLDSTNSLSLVRMRVLSGKGGRHTKLRSSSEWKACSSLKRLATTRVTEGGKATAAAVAGAVEGPEARTKSPAGVSSAANRRLLLARCVACAASICRRMKGGYT